MTAATRIVLVGFSGSGKTTVARLLAQTLGWVAVDTDDAIETAFGCTIPDIFATRGEAAFRAAERASLATALRQEHVVVATGGGAVVAPDAWGDDLLGRSGTLVVTLDAEPATMLRRLVAQQMTEGDAVRRPLLEAATPLDRITTLKATRQDAYDRADVTLIVDAVDAREVAAEIAGLPGVRTATDASDIRLDAPSGASSITIAPGASAKLGNAARARWPNAARAWLISDATVGPLHAPGVAATLTAANFDVRTQEVSPGEGSKSMKGAERLYDWLLEGGIERGDIVVALGGGMIGDLAGFVAATCLRGVGLVQVPTSLLAMVDSSVGGKTGINHRTGKNLIGAFYQPPLVVIDPTFLRTLPSRELTSGWAEIVKHAVIQVSTPGGERGDLLRFMERNAARLVSTDEPATSYLIRRNVALKAAVVVADERESGLRAILNFGHTLGHAIEAADYRYLHGEAIAVGLRAATRIGEACGTCDGETVRRLDALLDRFGLLQRAQAAPDRVLSLLGSDKKRSAGRQRWVLPRAEGGVICRDDVAPEVVRATLDEVVDAPIG